MKLKNKIIGLISAAAIVTTFTSCDDEFSEIGSDVIGDVNFTDEVYSMQPLAYTTKLEKVQTSGLQGYQLGVYDDPVYGLSTYSILSQIQPTVDNPTFGRNAQVTSVYLNLPYQSTVIGTAQNSDNETLTDYKLDSVYGSMPIKLSVYKSDYFLKDFQVDSEDGMVYYDNDIGQTLDRNAVEDSLLVMVESFEPSGNEVTITVPDGDDEGTAPDISRVSPRLRVQLPADYFQQTILAKEGSAELSNANNFRNYFRGLYLKAEPRNGAGTLMYFNMSQADITVLYSFEELDASDLDGDGDTTDYVLKDKELKFRFSNNIINEIEKTPKLAIPEGDKETGDEKLFVKGGSGGIATVKLFNETITKEDGTTVSELDYIREQQWLINEASLKLYVDQSIVNGGESEPERLYVFNLETGNVLADYGFDLSLNLNNDEDPVNSLLNHLGRISRGSDNAGDYYKINLTQHLIRVLEGLDENSPIGISVSQNVNITNRVKALPSSGAEDFRIPFTSVVAHEGTVIYGNTTAVPEEKQLKLEILYTKAR
ncbi:DUF4270 domain-containing protein [Aquimarina intermedia]|uniref:Uncharacterized protein DUF4270 n=1 Tax=Aquimarina intermedia TaxID=350814 RepID=A0A5S5CEK2_9FLAO|nr:DUF4270 domain-containing protein [Aquimarina intermedia]TYP77088.1 uncharacterized protein DUF4270 [Aquimarina intermedia]